MRKPKTTPAALPTEALAKITTLDELDRLVIHAMKEREWPAVFYTPHGDSLLVGRKFRSMTFHEAAIYYRMHDPGLSQFLESVTDKYIELLEGLTNQVMTNRDAWKRISLKRDKELQEEKSKPRIQRKKGTDATKKRAQERKAQFLAMFEDVKRKDPHTKIEGLVVETCRRLKEQGVKVGRSTGFEHLKPPGK